MGGAGGNRRRGVGGDRRRDRGGLTVRPSTQDVHGDRDGGEHGKRRTHRHQRPPAARPRRYGREEYRRPDVIAEARRRELPETLGPPTSLLIEPYLAPARLATDQMRLEPTALPRGHLRADVGCGITLGAMCTSALHQ